MQSYLNSLKYLHQNSSSPFFITDREGKIIWRNRISEKMFPSLSVDNGLLMIFPENLREKISKIKKTEVFNLTGMKSDCIVRPFEEFLAFIIVVNDEISFRDSAFEALISPVPPSQRYCLSEMFTSISSIYKIAEETEDERLFELSKNLNLNCYKILRASCLISSYVNEMKKEGEEGIFLLSDMFKNVASASRVIANEKGIDVDIEIEEGSFLVKGNEKSISDALINLIDNSIKYSDKGGTICLSLKKPGDSAIIKVSDKGIGIPGDVLPHIFKPYYSYGREGLMFQGVGLGLTNARLAVLNCGGSINISSKDYEGTDAIIRLPLIKDIPSDLSLKSDVTLEHLLRDRFSDFAVLMSDSGIVPLP